MLTVKKKFSHLGFAMIFYLVISNIIGVISVFLYTMLSGIILIISNGADPSGIANTDMLLNAINSESFTYILASTLPAYVLGVPLTLLFLNAPRYRDIPLKGLSFSTPYENSMKRDLSLKEFLSLFAVTSFFGILGSLIAAFFSYIVLSLTGIEMTNLLSPYLGEFTLPQLLVMTVILAPIFEELLFRYGVVGYCRRYGEWNAIIVSGVIFGFIHTNLFQFFYAFLLGALFAYVYIYTRQIKYTIALHVLFNFFGAFIPMLLSPSGDVNTLYTVYAFLQYAVAIIGFFILLSAIKNGRLMPISQDAPISARYSKDSFLNPGMICLIVFCIIITIVYQLMNI